MAAVTALATLALPIALGALLGGAIRSLRGRRFSGAGAGLALIAVPSVLVTALGLRFPLVGIWDTLLAGLLVGAGVEWVAHRAFGRRQDVVLVAASLGASLVALEIACRLFLPPPPGFPTAGGPHLLLADAMRADSQGHSWGLRSKEIVASVIYEEQYRGVLDVSDEADILVPRRFAPRLGVARRVLHIGDSMTFGFGVTRQQTFAAALERLEPDTQHINGGIPGAAPDGYLLVLRRWLARHDVDLAVMYLFEGNDLAGLDDHYPCCAWQSLLTYGPAGPAMRCPTASGVDLGKAGVTWLRYNSPPPYLIRTLIPYSFAAAHVGAAIVNGLMMQNPLDIYETEQAQFRHLEAILRAARDDLAAKRVGFKVVVLPARTWVENPTSSHLAPAMMEVVRRLGVPTLDLSEPTRDAVRRDEKLFLDNDPHFNPAGNERIAEWLHEWLRSES